MKSTLVRWGGWWTRDCYLKYFESTLTIFYRIYQIIESVSIFPKLDSWSTFDGILLLPKLCVMLGQLCFNWCLWQQERRLADHYQLPLSSPDRGTPPISPPLVFPPTGRNIVGVPSWWTGAGQHHQVSCDLAREWLLLARTASTRLLEYHPTLQSSCLSSSNTSHHPTLQEFKEGPRQHWRH